MISLTLLSRSSIGWGQLFHRGPQPSSSAFAPVESVDVSVPVQSSHGEGISPAFAWSRIAAKPASVPDECLRSVVMCSGVHCLLRAVFPVLLFDCYVRRGGEVCSVFGEGEAVGSLLGCLTRCPHLPLPQFSWRCPNSLVLSHVSLCL